MAGLDRDFFISELEACSGTLYRVARSILGNDQDCADAMQ